MASESGEYLWQVKQMSFTDDWHGLGNPLRYPSAPSLAKQERNMLLASVFGNICFGNFFSLL